MWDCEHCGCQAIAGDLTICPQCFTPRHEDVAAGPTSPDASASTIAAVEVREAPQPPADNEGWGIPDGKGDR